MPRRRVDLGEKASSVGINESFEKSMHVVRRVVSGDLVSGVGTHVESLETSGG